MKNIELYPLLQILHIEQDILEDYQVEYDLYCFHFRNSWFGKVWTPDIMDVVNYSPEKMFSRLASLADFIETNYVELAGASDLCKTNADRFLIEDYNYEMFKTDRIELRNDLKQGSITNLDYQKTLNSNKLKLSQTSEEVRKAYIPFTKNVFEFVEKKIYGNNSINNKSISLNVDYTDLRKICLKKY